ncbi:DUF3322 and DUF2220 domain-containing protein [Bifidobacterium samirii]|uniref:Wadjet protein JetD C-terminal domain-containing protein n=1 Tax=Bifidobacterium samirii TaxID=2306974 RepID=A0A430FTM5_9BIFI|nr:DUF3322 and DUF2220 domain-containing protein [Bifidobacterium samirii]RSX56265.1 hypothetical protein D2E24_1254 [Bifidobacterium samirii]
MKTRHDLAALIGKRLEYDMFRVEPGWPRTFAVNLPRRDELESDAPRFLDIDEDTRRWAGRCGLDAQATRRIIGGCPVEFVGHVTVPDERAALRAAPRATADAYRTARSRIARLQAESGVPADVAARVARMVRNENDADFDRLMTAAAYFAAHDTTGRTTRMVPLPGFSAKWLDMRKSRLDAIRILTGKDDLGLEERPAELRYRFLDPAMAGRPDQTVVEPSSYDPTTGIRYAVIVENKDTYRKMMPPIRHGICVFGSGNAAVLVPQLLPWLAAPSISVVYWGDLDARGFEILASLRDAGLDCASMLMDRATYDAYAVYGTDVDEHGNPIHPREPKPLTSLTDAERALYTFLCTGADGGHPRLEQERIPAETAADHLRSLGFPLA